MKRVVIENEEVGTSEDGPFRSYELSTEGDSLALLLENAQVETVDQDGGEVGTEGLYDCSGAVVEASERLIARVFLGAQGYKTTYAPEQS